jgi:hypothetical protein
MEQSLPIPEAHNQLLIKVKTELEVSRLCLRPKQSRQNVKDLFKEALIWASAGSFNRESQENLQTKHFRVTAVAVCAAVGSQGCEG